jgi:hypothetical protein
VYITKMNLNLTLMDSDVGTMDSVQNLSHGSKGRP